MSRLHEAAKSIRENHLPVDAGSDWPSCGPGTLARFEFSTADVPLRAPAGSRPDRRSRFSDLLVGLVGLSNFYGAAKSRRRNPQNATNPNGPDVAAGDQVIHRCAPNIGQHRESCWPQQDALDRGFIVSHLLPASWGHRSGGFKRSYNRSLRFHRWRTYLTSPTSKVRQITAKEGQIASHNGYKDEPNEKAKKSE
jgi:hypothetical protein